MSAPIEAADKPGLAEAVRAVSTHVHTDLVGIGAGNVPPAEDLLRDWIRLSETHGAFSDGIRGLGLAVIDATDVVRVDATRMSQATAHFPMVEQPGARGLLSLLAVARTASPRGADMATEARGMLDALGPDAHKATLNGVVEQALVGRLRPAHRRRARRRSQT